jgi:hypothetical protein
MDLMKLRRLCSQLFVPKRNLVEMLQVHFYLTLGKRKFASSPREFIVKQFPSREAENLYPETHLPALT